jgi:glycosyltransferase 2 family protein
MKKTWSRLKPYLHWIILGIMVLFLIKAFQTHWQEVAAIRIDTIGLLYLGSSLLVSLLAFACAGWVWSWTLHEFKHPLKSTWVIKVYLKTHLAKYLPGHLWHYYGRIWSIKNAGVSPEIATLSVVIEPFLMLAAALLTTLISSHLSGTISPQAQNWSLQVPCLVGILMIVHPRILNPVIRYSGKFKKKPICPDEAEVAACKIERYPLKLLIGEMCFMALRCGGFLLTFIALNPVNWSQLPMLVSAFSLAWLLSVVVPGAPGGVGVFEGTAIALLNQSFPTGVLLSIVALFRFITILAEVSGAGLAWLDERRRKHKQSYHIISS